MNLAFLFLSLLSLSSSFAAAATTPSSSTNSSSSSSCPMDLSYVSRAPWPVSDCRNYNPEMPINNSNNKTQCCQTLLSLYGISLSQHLKETSLFHLPNLPTSLSCLSDFQSKLNFFSLSSNLTSLCFDPLQFVITPNFCASIETTHGWVSKLGPSTSLDTACRPDLTDLTSCDACVAAGFRVQNQLTAIDGNTIHSTNCFQARPLGSEEWTLYEQVAIAAMDCQCLDVAKDCIKVLQKKFPGSKRVVEDMT